MTTNKLKSIRLKDMASKLEITPQYLSRIEGGKVDIKVSMLLKISDILEINPNDLLLNESK